jgi:hypothetical protein
MPVQPAPYQSRYWNNPQWHKAKLDAQRGPSPSDQWALHRLNRERQLAPGSDIRRALVDELQKEVTFARDTLNNFQERYDKSESLAAKEAWRERGDHFVRGLDPLVKTKLGNLVPLNAYDVLTSKREQFIRQNPPPRRPESDPSVAPGEHARYFLQGQQWKQAFDGATQKTTSPMKTFDRISEQFYAVIGDDGKSVSLVDAEIFNSNLEQVAEGFGTTAAQLLANNGRTPPKYYTKIINVDGKDQQVMVAASYDVINKRAVFDQERLGEAPSSDKLPYDRPPTSSASNADPVSAIMAYSMRASLPKEANWATRLFHDAVVDAGKRYKEKPDEFKRWFRDVASQYMDHYTFVMRTKEDEVKLGVPEFWDPGGIFGTSKIDIGAGSSVIMVPGKSYPLDLPSGEILDLIVAPDAIFDQAGQLISDKIPGTTIQEKLNNLRKQEVLDGLRTAD